MDFLTFLEKKNKHEYSRQLRCCSKGCRKWTSLSKGTIFYGTKLYYRNVIEILWYYIDQKIQSKTAELTSVSKTTVNIWFNKFDNIAFPENFRFEKISGPRDFVEIYEAHIYSNRRRIGRRLVGENIQLLGKFVVVKKFWWSAKEKTQ